MLDTTQDTAAAQIYLDIPDTMYVGHLEIRL